MRSQRQQQAAPADKADRTVPIGPARARRQALHGLITDRGFVSVTDVAREIGISDMTVRRDLESLERDGLIQRSHGGAMPAAPAIIIPTEPSFAARRDLHRDAKARIAIKAAGLVRSGDVLGLDVGSTVAGLAAELASRAGIEIVTNSLQTVLAMPQPVLPEVFLLGGRLRPLEGSLCGSITRQQLAGHWMDRVFIGVAGVDENGLYDYSPEEAEVKAAFMQQATAVTVLCDSSKFGRRSFVRVCGFEAIGSIVTDAEPPAAICKIARAAGVEIIIAAPLD
ncbi:DeoR/GlpR family DNA-binding transcription regulator [Acidisoma cladoniae]|jgi:DeoR/GlpR family transcriptional regulator of sugar metabolism|uniref:DeoR/GlpR family DNA-binding transcription regulator n=1 Tax=Acidisoma cladoniae TaxID=3040935 RepID=UPI00254F5E23|nr:DeoR/GlpR family DNA-binding transcription regulator [Acidisoma sp. PAMC 29798]